MAPTVDQVRARILYGIQELAGLPDAAVLLWGQLHPDWLVSDQAFHTWRQRQPHADLPSLKVTVNAVKGTVMIEADHGGGHRSLEIFEHGPTPQANAEAAARRYVELAGSVFAIHLPQG